jgi:hypothetical protein
VIDVNCLPGADGFGRDGASTGFQAGTAEVFRLEPVGFGSNQFFGSNEPPEIGSADLEELARFTTEKLNQSRGVGEPGGIVG